MILSISGLAGSGKDESASILVGTLDFKRVSFADSLKELSSEVFNIPLIFFHDVKLKDNPFGRDVSFNFNTASNLLNALHRNGYELDVHHFDQFIGTKYNTPRELLVHVGTDICRNTIEDDIWVNIAKNKLNATRGNVVVTDARFQNERDMLKNLGGFKMFIDRPEVSQKFDPNKAHISEVDQLKDQYDVTIVNDRTKEELKREVYTWVNKHLRG